MNKCIDGKFTLLTSSGGILATNKDAETILEKLGDHVGRLECPCTVEIDTIQYGVETFNIIAGAGTTATEIRATINNDVFSYSSEWQSVAGVGLEITGTPDMFSLMETALQEQAETWITLEGTNNGGLSVCGSVVIPVLPQLFEQTELLFDYDITAEFTLPACSENYTYSVIYDNAFGSFSIPSYPDLRFEVTESGTGYAIVQVECGGVLIALLAIEVQATIIP